MTTFERKFDLEQRLLRFSQNVRDFLQLVPNSTANFVYKDQLLRSSSSIGANYIEANDALGKGDFLMKIKTSRREAKETRYWLQLLELQDIPSVITKQKVLIDEADQLVRILSSIILKLA